MAGYLDTEASANRVSINVTGLNASGFSLVTTFTSTFRAA
jgi:hypothetical protein